MEKLFLLENDLKKISILRLLITENSEMSLHALKERVGYSYSKLQTLTSELDTDLKECFGLHILTQRGRLQSTLTLRELSIYQSFLIKKSVPYRFLLWSLLFKNYQLADFAREHLISQASISRRLQPLKAYLKPYGIKLNSASMKLIGEELPLRILLFNLLWLVDQGAQLRQQMNVPATVDLSEDLAWMTNISQQELLLWLAIFKARQEKGYFIEKALPQEFCLPDVSQDLQNLFGYHLSETKCSHDMAALSYLLIYWPVYFDHKDPRIPYLVKTYQGSTLDYLSSIFFSHCEETFLLAQLSAQERKLLYINLLNTFGHCLHKMANGMPSILDFMEEEIQHSALFYRQTKQAVSNIFAKLLCEPGCQFVAPDTNKLIPPVAFHLLPYFDPATSKKLSVGIQADGNQFLVGELISYCRTLPFVSTEVIGGCPYKKYDVIITIQAFNSFEIIVESTQQTQIINDLAKQSLEFSALLRKQYDTWLDDQEHSSISCH